MAHDAHEALPGLAHHFESYEQQKEAATLGMWTFLVTEILFFGGLFAAYSLYRSLYPEVFRAASHTLDIRLGAFNTAVLIGSSLTMALAVRGGQLGRPKATFTMLVGTLVLGSTILVFMLRPALRGAWTPANHNFLEGFGLYWHFVDLIWIFLFPLLYLIGRHH